MTIPYESGHGLFANPAGTHYIRVMHIDLADDPGDIVMTFGPGRCTVKWRGKRFNLPSPRVIDVTARFASDQQ